MTVNNTAMIGGEDIPRNLYRAEQVRELDHIAINDLGIPGMVLMERAGLAAFRALRQQWPRRTQITVVCGTGNNGGDGFVVARRALEAGLKVKVGLLGEKARLKGDALAAYQRLEGAGLSAVRYEKALLEGAEVVVDALFGTGLDRTVEGVAATALEDMHQIRGGILSIDIPSGLHADTGSVLGVSARADVTVSFIGLKQGMFTGQGREYCGRVVFDDLAVPAEVYRRLKPAAQRIEYHHLTGLLPPRARAAHKGHFGHVLIVGGAHGLAGAVRLAGEAAARVGAGLVSIATRAEHATVIGAPCPELMCHGVASSEDLAPLLERASVIAIGPGLGQSAWARTMLEAVLGTSDLPLVVDADALNLIAQAGHCAPDHHSGPGWVLTPHPGEAARLLGRSVSEVQADRFAAIQALGAQYGGSIILKGSGTLVWDEEFPIAVAHEGNPGMAVGGMGDVLTGVIAGLLAQGLPLAESARLGVCVHARAGDVAAEHGERGLLARDLIQVLRPLANPV
jgi:hydroxyethylthiazole kinase-like uncharacterized protein yjeF